MNKQLKKKERRVNGYAIVWKHGANEILEAYDDVAMFDTFETLGAARLYLKRYFTKKQWPNYNRDVKVVPCTITYEIPSQ